MYLMYVDESGDPGKAPGSSEHYILSGVIIHYKQWSNKLDRLKKFRKYISQKYNLGVNTEIHATELLRIKKIKAYTRIKKSDRIKILNEYATYIPNIFKGCKVINVSFNKSKLDLVDDIPKLAWGRLISRYDSYLKKTVKDEGMIFADEGNDATMRLLLRKMRVYNPIRSYWGGTYNAKITKIIEDVTFRKSNSSYFIQTVDVIAFLLYRMDYPKGSTKKYNLDKMFPLIGPVLLTEASPKDPYGVVRH